MARSKRWFEISPKVLDTTIELTLDQRLAISNLEGFDPCKPKEFKPLVSTLIYKNRAKSRHLYHPTGIFGDNSLLVSRYFKEYLAGFKTMNYLLFPMKYELNNKLVEDDLYLIFFHKNFNRDINFDDSVFELTFRQSFDPEIFERNSIRLSDNHLDDGDMVKYFAKFNDYNSFQHFCDFYSPRPVNLFFLNENYYDYDLININLPGINITGKRNILVSDYLLDSLVHNGFIDKFNFHKLNINPI